MALALLERPDGSLASPFAGDPAVVLPALAALLPAAVPAVAAGACLFVTTSVICGHRDPDCHALSSPSRCSESKGGHILTHLACEADALPSEI